MEKIIDARGLACPRPVMLTKEALKDSKSVTCIVDNPTARDNVSRLAAKEGCRVTVEERDGAFYLHLNKESQEIACQVAPATSTVMLIGSESLGRGSDELGAILIRGLMHTLAEGNRRPSALIFINSGVKLVTADSPVLEDLRSLASQGVEILACGTCLGYYELKDKLAVGQVSNMYSIVEAMLDADKVLSV